MVENAADTKAGTTRVACHLGEISVERRTNFTREKRLAVFRAKHEVHENLGKGLRQE